MTEESQTKWPKRLFAAAILLLTLYTGYTAGNMRIYSAIGPGPGLFPLALSIILAVLTVIWLLARINKDEIPPAVDWRSYRRSISIVVTVILSTAVMSYLGFFITSCLVMSFITYEIGTQKLVIAALFGISASAVFYLLFHWALGLNFPNSSFSLLQPIGI
jgi:hypothetical protein